MTQCVGLIHRRIDLCRVLRNSGQFSISASRTELLLERGHVVIVARARMLRRSVEPVRPSAGRAAHCRRVRGSSMAASTDGLESGPCRCLPILPSRTTSAVESRRMEPESSTGRAFHPQDSAERFLCVISPSVRSASYLGLSSRDEVLLLGGSIIKQCIMDCPTSSPLPRRSGTVALPSAVQRRRRA
jgi:hypothetical protein